MSTTTQKAEIKVCHCNQYCIDSICQASDSALTVRFCWCPECKDMRKSIKLNANKAKLVK